MELDSNEFLSKSLRHYIRRNLLAYSTLTKLTKLTKNPFFEAISLHGQMGPLRNNTFLDYPFFLTVETFTLALLMVETA
jgi:hypothetical protein